MDAGFLCLANALISASLHLFQYVDTLIEGCRNSHSKYQNRKRSPQSAAEKLACIVRRGWLGTFWRGTWNNKKKSGWLRLCRCLNIQFGILKPAIMNIVVLFFYFILLLFFFYHGSRSCAGRAFLPSGLPYCYSTQLAFISSAQNQIYSQLYKLPPRSRQVAANFSDEEIPCQEQPREKVSVW